jgi:hypothetical protein
MLSLVSAHIVHLILEIDFNLYSHKWLYFAGFQRCRRSTEDQKWAREMLCGYILKETIDRKGNFYNGAPWVRCSQKLETCYIQSSLDRCCFLRNLLSLLGWGQMFPGLGNFLMTRSKQALMNNMKLDVILLVDVCDVRMWFWCFLAVVAAISWLVPGWQNALLDICKFLASYRIQQANVGVAYVAVTGIN